MSCLSGREIHKKKGKNGRKKDRMLEIWKSWRHNKRWMRNEKTKRGEKKECSTGNYKQKKLRNQNYRVLPIQGSSFGGRRQSGWRWGHRARCRTGWYWCRPRRRPDRRNPSAGWPGNIKINFYCEFKKNHFEKVSKVVLRLVNWLWWKLSYLQQYNIWPLIYKLLKYHL